MVICWCDPCHRTCYYRYPVWTDLFTTKPAPGSVMLVWSCCWQKCCSGDRPSTCLSNSTSGFRIWEMHWLTVRYLQFSLNNYIFLFFFCKDSKLHVNLIKTISWMYESYSKKLSYEATDDNKKNEKCSLVKKLTSLLDDEYHSLGTLRSPVKRHWAASFHSDV